MLHTLLSRNDGARYVDFKHVLCYTLLKAASGRFYAKVYKTVTGDIATHLKRQKFHHLVKDSQCTVVKVRPNTTPPPAFFQGLVQQELNPET